MKQVLAMLMVGWVAWFIVLALLRGLSSLSDDEAAAGAPERAQPSRPSTPPPAAPATARPKSRATNAPRVLVDAQRSAPTQPVPVMVRAALVGHAQPGPVRAVLRQPVQLASASLPTGATLEGTADALPDGRFLLRFDAAPQANGSTLPVTATGLVEADAAQRRPLTHSSAPARFEFDLRFAPLTSDR